MTRVYTAFVGCKVSQADADGLGAALQQDGHVRVEAADAQVSVVVTCCVTAEAERKSRQLVNRLAAGLALLAGDIDGVVVDDDWRPEGGGW